MSDSSKTSASIPETVKIKEYSFKVTAVGDKAFQKKTKLNKITLGSNITSIGKISDILESIRGSEK